MAKVVLDSVASGYDLSKINANFQTLATALENTLSRDGTIPNSMSADLDMNGQRIINAVADGGNGFIWEGAWVTATSYAMNNLVRESGNTYICLSSHISGVFATDLAAGKWELVASKGSSGAGTGDMLSTNNLSELTNTNDARTNLGVAIGIQVQAYDADIPTVAASQVEMEAGTESALRSMSPLRVAQAIDALSATGAAGDVQTFNSGISTWTKPASGTMALIEVWGAGGSGARRSAGNSGGGAGGGYTLLWKKLSDLGATETVTIGTGGAAQNTDSTDGNNGGTTSFGSHVSHIGGSGGNQAAAGINAVSSQPGGVNAVQGPYTTPTTRSGANSAAYMTAAANAPAPIGTAGQSSNVAAADTVCSTPNPSFMGGGCGGNVSTVLAAASNGGTSIYGGAGGNGARPGAGSTGAQPGGGGGAGTTQGGAGGDGRVKVSVF